MLLSLFVSVAAIVCKCCCHCVVVIVCKCCGQLYVNVVQMQLVTSLRSSFGGALPPFFEN